MITISVITMAGDTISLTSVSPNSPLGSLAERVAERLSVPVEDVHLSCGEARLLDAKSRALTLRQLGLADGATLDCVIMPIEQFLDEDNFGLGGLIEDHVLITDPVRTAVAKAAYVDEYRLRRRTVAFAQNAAGDRELRRRALKASPWTFPETSDPLAEYDSRRRTVQFAMQAAAERERRLQELLVPVSESRAGNADTEKVP